jgi:hypothetical protein
MQLEEQELIQRACQESFLAAGSTSSSGGAAAPAPARLPVQEVVAAAAAAQPVAVLQAHQPQPHQLQRRHPLG